jgi:hypothetical protein
MSTESIPDSSACRAKRSNPACRPTKPARTCRSIRFRYRDASRAEPIATSPPLGSIEWNLALMVPSIGLGSEGILTTER